MTRTIIALFRSLGDAGQVRRELEAAGIPSRDINISNNDGQQIAGTTATRTGQESESTGLLDWLFGVPESEATAYREGVERGETLVTIRTQSDEQADRVTEILGRYDPIDIDERTAPAGAREGLSATAAGATVPPTGAMAATPAGTGARQNLRAGEEVHVPVVEEELAVGKREVNRGGVRVRSYVVERPVDAEVRLRDETVRVERRPASGEAPVAPDAFKERSYEVTERDEEAVVAKTARVKEEVVIGKDVQERTEHVRDTVRRTEVEVETADAGAGTASRGPATPGTRPKR